MFKWFVGSVVRRLTLIFSTIFNCCYTKVTILAAWIVNRCHNFSIFLCRTHQTRAASRARRKTEVESATRALGWANWRRRCATTVRCWRRPTSSWRAWSAKAAPTRIGASSGGTRSAAPRTWPRWVGPRRDHQGPCWPRRSSRRRCAAGYNVAASAAARQSSALARRPLCCCWPLNWPLSRNPARSQVPIYWPASASLSSPTSSSHPRHLLSDHIISTPTPLLAARRTHRRGTRGSVNWSRMNWLWLLRRLLCCHCWKSSLPTTKSYDKAIIIWMPCDCNFKNEMWCPIYGIRRITLSISLLSQYVDKCTNRKTDALS